MKYEWKKVLRTPFMPVLFVCLVLLDLWLFSSRLSQDMGGYTFAQVSNKYGRSAERLEQENEMLLERLRAGEDFTDETLLTGDLKYERDLNQELLQRKQATQSYPQVLASLRAEIDLRLSTGIFGELDDFSRHSLEALDARYAALTGTQVPDTFTGNVEVISDWQLSDALLLLFGLSTGLLLLTQERSNGQAILLHPTKRGRAPLYLRKYSTMLCAVLLGFFLLHGAHYLLAGSRLGYCDLAIPIQTVYGFSACAEKWTVLQYLLAFYAQKLLWTVACCTLLFCLCAAWKKTTLVCACTVALAALAALLGSSPNLWHRSLSLTGLTDTKALYQSCTYLNFFGDPIRQSIAVPVLLSLITLACFACGLLFFCRLPAVSAAKGRRLICLPIPKHTVMLLHEGRKVLFTNAALWLLILLALLQVVVYGNTHFPKSEWEVYYAQYSETLNGEKALGKEAFLQQEAAYFEELEEKLSKLEAAAGDDDGLYNLLSQDVLAALRAKYAFQAAKAQYDLLSNRQSYVYATGYSRLFDRDAIRADLGDTAKLIAALTLAFAALFANEFETGVVVLQTTAGARRKVLRRKLLLAAAVTLLFVIAAYAPRFVCVWQCFGLPELDAQANSLTRFSGLPDAVSLRELLIVVGAIRLLLAEGITAVILLLSHKTKNTIATILLSFGLLLLPCVSAALLL